MGQGEYSRGFSISPIHRSIKSNILSPSNLIFIITSYKYIIGIEYHILYNIYVIIEAKKLQLEDSQVICKYRRVIYVYNGICISDLYCPCNGPSFIAYILAYIIPQKKCLNVFTGEAKVASSKIYWNFISLINII